MFDFGLCWDFKVRSHRCTNDFGHWEKDSKATGNSLKKQAGKKVRPNSGILSITTQIDFLLVHMYIMSIRQSLVCLCFFPRQLALKCCLQIADHFTTETSFIIIIIIIIKFWEQSRLETYDCIYILFWQLIFLVLHSLSVFFFLLFSILSFRNWLRGILFISIFYSYKQFISWLTT